MAVLVTDFRGFTVGEAVPNTTERWVTALVTRTVQASPAAFGGKLLRATPTTTGRRALSFDGLGSSATWGLRGRLRLRDLTGAVDANGIICTGLVARGSGLSGNETGWVLATRQRSTGAHNIQLSTYENGSFTAEHDVVTERRVGGGGWLWLELLTDGDSIEGRYWFDGEQRPSSPSLSVSTSDVGGSGWGGVFKALAGVHEFDTLVGATGSDELPTGVISGTVTSGGSPVEGALVCAFDPVGGLVYDTALTDASGEYAIPVYVPVPEASHAAVQWQDPATDRWNALSLPFLTPLV